MPSPPLVPDPRGTHYDRLRWVQPGWLAEATAWIREELEARAVAVTGEISQPHVQWWSTVLRVPTSEGLVYFKAVESPHVFEASLTEALWRWRPDCIPAILALDAEQGWLLMLDGGTRLRDVTPAGGDLARWEQILPLYADLQIDLAPRRDELLSLGVRDVSLGTIPTRYQELLEDTNVLLLEHSDGLTAEEHRRLRELAPQVRTMCEKLSAYGVPETLQHDDFHDGNVLVGDRGYRFFDWGDSCVSHPFHTLVVTLRLIAYGRELEPGGPALTRLRDAYLEAWTGYGRREELAVAFALAYRIGTLGRALAWRDFVSAMDAPFAAENVDSVPYGLKLFLADGAIGSWR